MRPLELKPWHFLVDTELARYLRRELHDPLMITYWNAMVGAWVIARRLSHGANVVIEHYVLHTLIGPETRDAVEAIRESRSPQAIQALQELRQVSKNQEHNELTALQEEQDFELDIREHMRSQCNMVQQDNPAWDFLNFQGMQAAGLVRKLVK